MFIIKYIDLQVAITSPEKRKSYLDPMGMNYKQLEKDFF